MKYFFLLTIIVFCLSCGNDEFDVIVKQSNGIVYKYKCKNGKDTSNCVKYRYYKSLLVSKVTIVNSKKEGIAIDYYPNGAINIISSFRNNKAHGINKVFNDQGGLLRRSFYVNNKQVLFESIMENAKDSIVRKKIIRKSSDQGVWAGELYTDFSGNPLSVGEIIENEKVIGDYQGMYVEINIDDTINLRKDTIIELKITYPGTILKPIILVGEFDRSLKCIDTIHYASLDSVKDTYYFMYTPHSVGDNYLIGKLSSPKNLATVDLFFFKGFYTIIE